MFRRSRVPLEEHALRSALVWSAGITVVGLLAGAVRLLPWLLDPAVPLRVALPFARSVAELAIEAAILVGWPVGWALAAYRFAERGEARTLMLLGQSPARIGVALWPSAAPFAIALALASIAGAYDASAPGKVAMELVAQGRASCANVSEPKTFAVPFVGATWLCEPGTPPRLYGRGPGGLSALAFTASNAHIAGDMRRIELDDARLSFAASFPVDVHATTLVLRGMSPWARASSVPPLLRAIAVVLAAALAAFVAVQACLRRTARGPLVAVLLGVAGPLAALGFMRALERGDHAWPGYFLVPILAAAAPAALAYALPSLKSKLAKL